MAAMERSNSECPQNEAGSNITKGDVHTYMYCRAIVEYDIYSTYKHFNTAYPVIIEGLVFHRWQLGKDHCDCIFEVQLYPSYGMYPNKEKI